MKKINILLIVFLLSISVSAQKKDFFLTNIDVIIYCSVFDESKEKLHLFVKASEAEIIGIDENKKSMHSDFYISEHFKANLDTLITELGFLSSKKISISNFNEKINEINLQIKYNENKKSEYEKEIKSMNEKDKRYYEYWEIIRGIEKNIFDLQKDLSEFKTNKKYKVSINIYDDTVDLTNQKVSWVNMPGLLTEILFVETPLTNLSAERYMGYSLNYLITKGKTHFTLGILKKMSDEKETDSLQYTELFFFGIGQDFYTKHLGRGNRKWFNLYTGYNVGGIFATGETSKTALPYLKAFVGAELFKNKYILIDNKVGYFVPFKYNRNLRGITYNFSINFVF